MANNNKAASKDKGNQRELSANDLAAKKPKSAKQAKEERKLKKEVKAAKDLKQGLKI